MRKRAWWSGFACGVVVAGVAVSLTQHVPQAAATGSRFDREAFHQGLDAVLDRYIEPVDGSALLAASLEHIVSGLDEHSHFLTAKQRKAMRERAKGGTVGLSVHLRSSGADADRGLEIVGVMPESTAAAAGLKPGDRILEINGHEASSLSNQLEAEACLGGRVGDLLAMRVQRAHDAAPRKIELELEAPPKELVTGKLLDVTGTDGRARKVAFMHLRAFRSGVGEAVKNKLARLRRAAGHDGVAGIVLDLRANPGGAVDEALVVADLFVADGILTRTRGRGGTILREERAHEAGTDSDTPIVVLQDRYTASAAELLTAALRGNGRAKSVGERSYGKGTVQEVLGLPDGSVLKLTIARYFSPKDEVIDGVGLEPDVAVAAGDRGKVVDEGLAVLGFSR